MRFEHLPLLLAICCGVALAQTPLPPVDPPARNAKQRPDQRIERIHLEDAGSRIDEVRYGGETQSITVQPKANVPAYEILPTDGAHSHPASRDGVGPAAGQRVWNFLHF